MDADEGRRVVITGVELPIGDLTLLLIKLTIAAVPAVFVGAIVWFFASAVFIGFFGAFS
jgi:hypothetical protein